MHAPSRTPLLLPLLLSHNLPTPRVRYCVMSGLIHTGLGSSSLIAHVLSKDGNPLGWLARGRRAGGRGFGSLDAHIGEKGSAAQRRWFYWTTQNGKINFTYMDQIPYSEGLRHFFLHSPPPPPRTAL